MDKATLLHKVAAIVDEAKLSDDVQVRMSALNIERTLVICAAGLDEELIKLTHEIGHRAAAECMRLDFGGGPENAEHN